MLGTNPSDSQIEAPFRLLLAFVVTTLIPGYAVMRALGWFHGAMRIWERLPLAFGVGYGVVAVVCALGTTLHLSLAQAFVALTFVSVLLAFLPEVSPAARAELGHASRSFRPRLALLLAIAIVLVGGWFVEPPITGEETVELISIRKIAQNPFISLDGILPEPGAIPTYVIAPYYFLVALISKASGLSIFAAYLKLRALYAALAILTFAAVSSRLLRSDNMALVGAMALGLVALIFVDPSPWSWPASLFPLIRRGGYAAGVLAPIFMLAILVYVVPRNSDLRSRFEWVAPGLLLLTILTTHAMEILYVGFFGLAVMLCRQALPTAPIQWNRIAVFATSGAIAAIAFKWIHGLLVSHVHAFEAPARAQILAGLRSEIQAGTGSLRGISEAGRYLISTSGEMVPYAIFGILLTPVLVRFRPMAGTVLWAGTVVPLGVYSSSKLFALLQLATSSEIVFIFGYFTFLGTMAFLATVFLGVNALTARLSGWIGSPAAGFLPLVPLLEFWAMLAAYVVAVVLRKGLPVLLANPLALFWLVAVGGVVALLWRRGSLQVAEGSPITTRAVALFVALILSFAWGLRGTGNLAGIRQPLPQAIAHAMHTPSVLDWPRYYPLLQASTNPKIDLPAHIVADLERVLPPLQIIAADPVYSFALPVVLNQYIVNPGHRISTSLTYFERFTYVKDGRRVHPIFNTSNVLSSNERRFLLEFRVQYILVNPENHDIVRMKLEAAPSAFDLVYERDRHLLYRVNEKRLTLHGEAP